MEEQAGQQCRPMLIFPCCIVLTITVYQKSINWRKVKRNDSQN